MLDGKTIYAIIPARSGSKGVPKKNIIDLGGFPLIAYSIIAAKLSKCIDRVIVSTDSEEIATIAKKYGAEVPFLRPAELATDKSADIEFVNHALKWFKDNEQKTPDYIVHLRPTTPLRDPELVDKAIKSIVENPDATSLRSGYEIRESPYKLFGIENGFFTGLFPSDPRPEYYNLPRQAFPPVYQPDGYVDVLVSDYVIKTGRLHGDKILAFVSPNVGEIDTLEDLAFMKYSLEKQEYAVHQYLKKHF
jgi:CMP-N-acetylneuraminic acid synthetase